MLRILAPIGLVGIQQAVPGPLLVSLVVTLAAGLAGAWAIATLRRA